ncbi:MAG: imidazole glycerol phosphate synthase subunit HisH [Geothrix sp.]|jgi:imidazole glycerol phosphate synthase glutamine amidotransferase subunit|uniref:Imidazole glycerol phosphate synthase subunit HisH n=1 Tax=Candidatus Geothrix odensensis TaxID=2954440 RepID=A0A936EZY3_9BACT|nr:imidazole glycerol phosphate synthase subunit HisH [Candidatus Geothrix odensensis]MBP7617727.1 imidazole glycerol phosphate synthase subunit HisH [Geothrix sp.]
MSQTITLIDYDAGNLASLEGALDRLGLSYQRAATPDQAAQEGPVILPGVGHFEAAQRSLRERGWWRVLPSLVAEGRPLLGICLGLQLLAEGSEEAPRASGLGLLPGIVRRLGPGVKVPHMGWSRIRQHHAHPALPDPHGGWLYFVHSYALAPTVETIYVAEHGRPFAAVEARGTVMGFQPHPEKSGRAGLLLLQSALAWMGATAPLPEVPCN